VSCDRSQLEPLVGEWDLEVLHPAPEIGRLVGASNAEWVLDGAFVVQRLTIEHPQFPDWLVVIGPADGDWAYHYYDTRGVSRTFRMRIEDRTWSFLRMGEDFYQRFTLEFAPDDSRFVARIDMSHDEGRTWSHDFDMRFSRVSPRP
jgi:hypothetical protein